MATGEPMTDTYDVIIVGAGSAGATLAARLSEDGNRRVLLLEAGPRDSYPWIHIPIGYCKTMFHPVYNWRCETEPDPGMHGRRIYWPRGRCLGGSSSVNGMMYVRGQPADFDAIAEKLPETAPEKPDPKITAQFEAVAKKYGFASYDEYNDVVDTISLVLGGFDPATKKYVGADNVIRGQIAAVEADKTIPDEDRKQALEQLNDALKAPVPPIENKANIELVAKYYDKLNATLQQGE